jgi:hypothetical protein
MNSELYTFILKIATESEALAEFKKDPGAYLAGSDLSKEEKDMIVEGDPQKIRHALLAKAIGQPVHPDNVIVVVYTATYVKDPSRD